MTTGRQIGSRGDQLCDTKKKKEKKMGASLYCSNSSPCITQTETRNMSGFPSKGRRRSRRRTHTQKPLPRLLFTLLRVFDFEEENAPGCLPKGP